MQQIPTKLQGSLERIAVELCGQLPGNTTLLEKDGFCRLPTDYCQYRRPAAKNDYLCNKKTLTPLAEVYSA